jgi:lipopolysaccharide/colanic/teichoic acid biosynthesis glycosyltransferase
MNDFFSEDTLIAATPPANVHLRTGDAVAKPSVVRPDGFLNFHAMQTANLNGPFTTAGSGAGSIAAGLVPAAAGRPVMNTSGQRWYLGGGKRLLDIALVLATLPVSAMLVLLCALALWIEGGVPFYRQDRLGRQGKVFSILKLRTMVRDADALLAGHLKHDPGLRAEWESTQKLKTDPRVTRVGAMLRATSLDELPQLWNVLKGEMSLVGPRPMMPEQLPLYGDARAYFALTPGLTGAWQVSARNETHFAYRAKVDAAYYASVSALGDLVLMARTVGVVLRRTGY